QVNISFEEPLEEVLNLSTHDTLVEPDLADMTFKNSLDRLILEMLRILCNAEGLSVSGSKKDFQINEDHNNQASNRLKGNNRRFDQAQVFDQSVEFVEEKVLEERRFLSLESSMEKSLQATLIKAIEEMKSSLQSAENRDNDKFWSEVKMNRPKDQFEYDELRKIEKELDEALVSKSLEPIVRAKEIAYT
ncbi:4883_t:CDS:2, partial [Cetraspora pellucida]